MYIIYIYIYECVFVYICICVYIYVCLYIHIYIQKVKMSVAQSCPTVCEPMDCSLQVSSVHGILQARILEWGVAYIFTWKSNLDFFSLTFYNLNSLVSRKYAAQCTTVWLNNFLIMQKSYIFSRDHTQSFNIDLFWYGAGLSR